MSGKRNRVSIGRAGRMLTVPLLLSALAACTTTSDSSNDKAEINNTTKFASASYGVKASPRVTTSKTVRVGGGHYQVGKPYEVAGRWYHPKVNDDYSKTGLASWYGPNFHGRLTANGEVYNQYSLTAAHPTLPLPCYARVTNEDTGDSVIVRVNDRGPFAKGRIIDLSNGAAKLLHMRLAGVAKVHVKYVGMAPLDGDDSSYLMASYHPGEDGAPSVDPDTGQTGVMVAMNTQPLPGVSDDSGSSVIPTPRPEVAPTANALVSNGHRTTPAEAGIRAVMVPQSVPLPAPRPTRTASLDAPARQLASTASAYRSATRDEASDAFDTVLAGQKDHELTAEAIVRSWNNRLVAQN